MRVIEPSQLKRTINDVKRNSRHKKFVYVALLILFGIATVLPIWLLTRPLPVINATNLTPAPVQINKSPITWPEYGQAAIGAKDYGVLDTYSGKKPVPMASVAKIMAAISVLKQKPLETGQQGPQVTLTARDVALYDKYVEQNGSVLPINEGEQLSEYQMIQGVLLPSANNITDTLVIWAFGSMEAYLQYANNYAKELGMTETNFADASGFSEQSVSTAQDLVLLGIAAMQQPVIAEIVGQKEANLPIAGKVANVNYLLGQNEIIGIKTGNTDAAGGCYLFAVRHKFTNGQEIILVGAIMNAPSLQTAMKDTLPLIKTGLDGLKLAKIIQKGQSLGRYDLPWGGNVEAVIQNDVSLLIWQNETPRINVRLNSVKFPQAKNTVVGSLEVQTKTSKQTVNLVTQSDISRPSWRWRLIRK